MNIIKLAVPLAVVSCVSAALAADGEMSRPSGIKIGPRMTLRPYVSLSFTYDSNVDQMKHSDKGSQWIVNPGFTLDYVDDNWNVEGAAFYQYHAYNNYSSQQDQHNYGESLRASWTNSRPDEKGWSLMFTERFQQINQDDDLRTNNGRGIGRDRKEFTADGAIERRVNEYVHASMLASYYLLDYDNDADKYAALYGWKRTIAGGEVGYAPTKWTDFILHASYQWYTQDNDYDRDNRTTEPLGHTIRSDSKGWSVMAGIGTHATEKITYRLLAGWSRFEYGGGAKGVDGWTYQVSSNWKFSETLSFMLLGSSYYQPSEREYGRCIKVNTLSLGAGKSLVRGKLRATVDLAFRNESNEFSSYAEDDYDENIWTVRARLDYTLNRYFTIFGGVDYQTEETSGGGIRGHMYDYDRWRGTVGVRLTY
ncbi:MAG: outer membrane beta-barrel protein [Kiritimatiellia bacterium]